MQDRHHHHDDEEKETKKRHTVPNARYPSFPCFEEEIRLKTNFETRTEIDNDPGDPAAGKDQSGGFNVQMQDKLKMCFANMQNLKDHFDSRRRRFPPAKKRFHQNVPESRQPSPPSLGSTQSAVPGPTKITVDRDEADKFLARLIRTRSKDSIEEDDDGKKREDDSPKPSATKKPEMPPQRPMSDPIGQFSRPRSSLAATGVNSNKQGFNEWLAKLEEINDMSRSTIDRIKKLENDISQLRSSTVEKLQQQRSTPPQPTSTPKPHNQQQTTVPVSRIPVTVPSSYTAPNSNRIFKRSTLDKSLNTDIDMELMNRILKYWDSRFETTIGGGRPSATANRDGRRLTATIRRSVEIQTETSGQKSFQDRAVVTDDFGITPEMESMEPEFEMVTEKNLKSDWQLPPKKQEDTMAVPILDLPILEQPTSTSMEKYAGRTRYEDMADKIRIKVATPEPIVEIYSDSEDTATNFDDFERNIFDEITKRAEMRSKLQGSKSQTDFYRDLPVEQEDGKVSKLPSKTTSTQTLGISILDPGVQSSEIEKEVPTLAEKKMQSMSRIVIERTNRMNQQLEKREIIIQTNIDEDGKVHRSTEIRNTRQNALADRIKIENRCCPPAVGLDDDDLDREAGDLKKEPQQQPQAPAAVNTEVKQMFDVPRTQSAFDLFEDDLLLNKDNEYLSNKAFSSMDISRGTKSPAVSEGYYSEQQLDSQRMSTPVTGQANLLEPPESFRGTPVESHTREKSASRETRTDLKSNFWVLNNETCIENIGNETNITTKSSTSRRPTRPTMNETDLDQEVDEKENKLIDLNYPPKDPQPRTPTANFSLPTHMNQDLSATAIRPTASATGGSGLSSIQADISHNQMANNGGGGNCKFSLIVNNYGTNVVFRADFGPTKPLPLFETNL